MKNIQIHSAPEAISQAIKGGWRGLELSSGSWIGCMVFTPAQWAEKHLFGIMCDPLFWHALGRTRGWIEKEYPDIWLKMPVEDREYHRNKTSTANGFKWFITHMEEKDETKFWESLP